MYSTTSAHEAFLIIVGHDGCSLPGLPKACCRPTKLRKRNGCRRKPAQVHVNGSASVTGCGFLMLFIFLASTFSSNVVSIRAQSSCATAAKVVEPLVHQQNCS